MIGGTYRSQTSSLIDRSFSNVKSSLEEQTGAYCPQITEKCNHQMQSLLEAIRNESSPIGMSESQTIYTFLTQKTYQDLFKQPPSILTRLFNWRALENWQKGKALSLQTQAACLLPFKDIVKKRLKILTSSDNTPPTIKNAAMDLMGFLTKPNDHTVQDDTLDLLKEESIFPEDLDFEKDADLIDIQLRLRNNLNQTLTSISEIDQEQAKLIKQTIEMVLIKELMPPKQQKKAFNSFLNGLRNQKPEHYPDLVKRFNGDRIRLKTFILRCLPRDDPDLNETFASHITFSLIPYQPLSSDVDILHWSEKELDASSGTISSIILAKLSSGNLEKINEANDFILTLKAKPKTLNFSKFLKSFAYYSVYDDFSTAIYTTILYRFKDVLTLEAKEHLLNNLLMWDGGEFSDKTPNLPLLNETENHILLINSSRYLKNKYLHDEGSTDPRFDNIQNGLEAKLLAKLQTIKETGLDEYNSIPYVIYSIKALLNLHDFGSLPIQKAAKEILDDITDRYAHASCGLKSFFPFRRQGPKGELTDLTYSYQLKALFKWLPKKMHPDWMSNKAIYIDDEHEAEEPSYMNDSRILLPACLSYKPQDKTIARLTGSDKTSYLTKISHSKTYIGGSPEIYYGGFAKGKKYLFSAGGAYPNGIYQDLREIIVRPTTLLLDDDATKLRDVFYLGSDSASEERTKSAPPPLNNPHKDAASRNNTGVYENFACGACPVHVPDGMKPIAENRDWKLYQAMDGLLVAVYSTEKLGIMVTFKDEDGLNHADLLRNIADNNSDPSTSFTFPDREITLTYDTKAPLDQWVMKSVKTGNITTDFERDFSKWSVCENTYLS